MGMNTNTLVTFYALLSLVVEHVQAIADTASFQAFHAPQFDQIRGRITLADGYNVESGVPLDQTIHPETWKLLFYEYVSILARHAIAENTPQPPQMGGSPSI